ncbi:hypothetical protein ACFLSQ_08995 [Bacteroidota bacterium]
MKKLFILIFSLIAGIIFVSTCETEKDKMIIIRNHIKYCTQDLVENHLKDSIRDKEYDFKGQTFSLYIDSTGKPIFFEDGKNRQSIFLKYEEKNYTVELKDGLIMVSAG